MTKYSKDSQKVLAHYPKRRLIWSLFIEIQNVSPAQLGTRGFLCSHLSFLTTSCAHLSVPSWIIALVDLNNFFFTCFRCHVQFHAKIPLNPLLHETFHLFSFSFISTRFFYYLKSSSLFPVHEFLRYFFFI